MTGLYDIEPLLPPSARMDLAQWEYFSDNSSFAQTITYRPNTFKFEVVQQVKFTLITNATVASRIPFIQLKDAEGNTIHKIAAAQVQTASGNSIHAFVTTLGTAYSTPPGVTTNFYSFTPYPLVVMQPGYQMIFGADNTVAGDGVQAIRMTVIKIPTGPTISIAPSLPSIAAIREISSL